MAPEKRLIPCGEKCTLDELPCGTLFKFGDDCIAVKSEYRCNNGLIEAFILDSGEQFWGGAHTAEEQNALMVQPLAIEEVDAVEVVRCEKCKHWQKCESSLIGDVMCCTGQGSMYIQKAADDFCSYGERRE